MNLVFFGNNDRGIVCLEELVARGYSIPLVVAHPDAIPVKQKSVKATAERMGIRVIQPANVNNPDVVRQIAQVATEDDIFVLAGYGQIIKQEILGLPRKACLNLHGGKLPQYRGSSPINWMILNGESEGGISIIEVDHGIDTGDILAQRFFEIGIDDDAASIQAKTLKLFPAMLDSTLQAVQAGTATRIRQARNEGSYYPVRTPADGLILWDQMTAWQVYNLVRALVKPFPGAFSYIDRAKVYVWRARLMEEQIIGIPGRIYGVRDGGVVVMCQDRCIMLETLQMEGGEVVPASQIIQRRGGNFATARDVLLAMDRVQ